MFVNDAVVLNVSRRNNNHILTDTCQPPTECIVFLQFLGVGDSVLLYSLKVLPVSFRRLKLVVLYIRVKL